MAARSRYPTEQETDKARGEGRKHVAVNDARLAITVQKVKWKNGSLTSTIRRRRRRQQGAGVGAITSASRSSRSLPDQVHSWAGRQQGSATGEGPLGLRHRAEFRVQKEGASLEGQGSEEFGDTEASMYIPSRKNITRDETLTMETKQEGRKKGKLKDDK